MANMTGNRSLATRIDDAGTWPFWVSLAIGVWMFISAFVWPHTAAEQTNTWILGVLIVIASGWAMYSPNIRFLNTIFAIWLFFATLFIQHSQAGTLWSNLIAAIIVFVMSLVPSGEVTGAGTQRAVHA